MLCVQEKFGDDDYDNSNEDGFEAESSMELGGPGSLDEDGSRSRESKGKKHALDGGKSSEYSGDFED